MKWVAAYIWSVVLVNAMFVVLSPFHIGGAVLTWGTFIVGATFILRDFAQREVGHRVLWATLAGTAITALMSPGLALASGVAFLASELADWAVFSRWHGSFRSRVVASSLVGAPLDSAVFLAMAGFLSWPSVAVMTASKLVALGVMARRATGDRR